LVQKGRGNEGEISQYGNDNTALIVQKSNVRNFQSEINQTGGQTHVIINGMNRNIVID
jgi:minor curlin subunit